MLTQLEVAHPELFRVAKREAEFKQVDAAHAQGIKARKQLTHYRLRTGNHLHLNHDVRQHRNGGRHALKYRSIRICNVFWFYAETDLVEPRFRQLR